MASSRVLATTDRSITWNCKATVPYDAAKLQPGATYTPVVGMSLVGSTHQGWKNPINLEIQTPDVQKSVPVDPRDIPVGASKEFPFPSFKLTTPKGTITLTATTQQEEDLDSMLVFQDRIKIAEEQYTDPLSIRWNLHFSTQCDAAKATPGTKYQFAFPLMLKGDSRQFWQEPVTLDSLLPHGPSPLPTPVDPENILLRTYRDFMSGEFAVTTSAGKITLKVITKQEKNLESPLVVGDIKLVPCPESPP